MDFGKHADYMALGYAVMAVLLGGMIVWMYLRYVALNRDSRQLDALEAELREDRVRETVGAVEQDAQPGAATPGLSGMAAPDSERARTLPGES